MRAPAVLLLAFLLAASLRLPNFEQYIQTYSYLGIFLWYISFDNIMPFPQEITLMIIGYLSANGYFNPYFAVFIAMISLVLDDLVYFFLSRKGSGLLKKIRGGSNSPLFKKLQPRLEHKTFATYTLLTFIPRARFFGPVILGLTKWPVYRFHTNGPHRPWQLRYHLRNTRLLLL